MNTLFHILRSKCCLSCIHTADTDLDASARVQVDIPKDYSSKRFLFRMVIIPKILFWRVIIPKIFITKG